MTDSPPQGFIDGMAALQRHMMPQPDVSDQVARNVRLTFCFGSLNNPVVAGDHVYLPVDFPCRVNGWDIRADRVGSVSFTVKGGLEADFPALTTIVAAAPPAMASLQKATGNVADVVTWTQLIPRDGELEAIVDSISGGIEVLTLSVRAVRLDW